MEEKPVSDHAIVRYIERVAGINLDFVRNEILKDCATGIKLGATGVRHNVTRYALSQTGVVKTVMTKKDK